MVADIRNSQSSQSVISEQSLKFQKEKNLIAETNILEFGRRLDDKEKMIKLWIGRHSSGLTQLSEQQLEA